MMGIMDFLSAEAGQRRRAWLDEQDAKVSEALRYYLGPTGIDKRIGVLGKALEFSDAGDVTEAADSSRALWNDPSINNAARYATAATAMMVPGLSARMANSGSGILADAGASLADDVRRFAGDEYGGIRSKGDDVARLVKEKYGVKPEISHHPTNWGESLYLRARIPYGDGVYTDVGFRLSDHGVGDFRKATDDVGTIIDGGGITPEGLMETIEDQYQRSLPEMEAKMASRKIDIAARKAWAVLPDRQKKKYKKLAIKKQFAGGADVGAYALFKRNFME